MAAQRPGKGGTPAGRRGESGRNGQWGAMGGGGHSTWRWHTEVETEGTHSVDPHGHRNVAVPSLRWPTAPVRRRSRFAKRTRSSCQPRRGERPGPSARRTAHTILCPQPAPGFHQTCARALPPAVWTLPWIRMDCGGGSGQRSRGMLLTKSITEPTDCSQPNSPRHSGAYAWGRMGVHGRA